jgi:hypothetical protein
MVMMVVVVVMILIVMLLMTVNDSNEGVDGVIDNGHNGDDNAYDNQVIVKHTGIFLYTARVNFLVPEPNVTAYAVTRVVLVYMQVILCIHVCIVIQCAEGSTVHRPYHFLRTW